VDYEAWSVDDEFDENGEPNGLGSDSSERRRLEPKCWLKFEDVVHCRDVESFSAFVEQILSERGLAGQSRTRTCGSILCLEERDSSASALNADH